MFTSAKFRNFKSLKDFTVPLKRVNILVGPNNAGKSSVLFNEAIAYLDSRWTNLSDKLTVVGGKQFLSSMNVYLQRELGISITATQILRTLVLPADCDLRRILVALDSFAATH
jgi:predicted ATP-dependent endonuclease of OLD family